MGSASQLAYVDTGSLSYEPSFFSVLKKNLDSNPDSPAVKVAFQSFDHLETLKGGIGQYGIDGNKEFSTWTYAHMQYAALKIVQGLQSAGMKSSSSIVSLIPNRVEYTLLIWTSMLGKYPYSALDPGALDGPRQVELETLLKDTQADAIFVVNATSAVAVEHVLSNLSKQPVLKIVLDNESVPRGWQSLVSLGSQDVSGISRERIEEEAMHDDLDRVWGISYTSGTTSGKPKGCEKTVKAFLHTSKAQLWGQLQGPGCGNALTTANFRIIAPSLITSTWRLGSCVVMPSPGFSPAELLRWSSVLNLNSMVLVPFMLHILTSDPAFSTADKSTIKTVMLGGDMITRNIYNKAALAFPDAHIQIAHGMTEGGGCFVWPQASQLGIDQIPWHADIGPVGKVQSGLRLKVVDDDNQILPRTAIGELHFCSEAFIKHYQYNVKPEDFYTDAEGSWFKTGDISKMDEDGWVFILGRKKDIIKRAGVSITPAAIESALDGYLKSQTSVLAIPHPTLGQEPFAVVRDLNGVSKHQVVQHILEIFGKDSPLRGVATLSDLGLTDFPITTTGKILKRALESEVAKYLNEGTNVI